MHKHTHIYMHLKRNLNLHIGVQYFHFWKASMFSSLQ